jgi:hypothetical protein
MKTKEYYEARIELLSGRDKENGRIIQKLKRQLRALLKNER